MRKHGRFCWACQRRRPNERFSRRSGLLGVCRDCRRLGPAELAYRQALVDLERAVGHHALIPRKRRSQVEAFLRHADPRVCAYALEIFARDAATRREWKAIRAAEEAYELRAYHELAAEPTEPDPHDSDAASWDDDLPF